MGTGVGIRQENSKNQKLTAPRLPDIDKAKVAKIVDVCNVSFDEACRVLEACHMDLDMAINRFLSGTETTTWSEVSKKKKTVVPPRNSSGQRHGRGRDHERERDRRERDRPSGNSSETHSGGYRGRQSRSNGHQAPREGNANGAQRSNDTDAPAASRTYHNAPKRTSEHADYRAAAAESGKASTVPPTTFESVAPAAHRPTPPEKDNAGAPVSTELNWKPPQRQVPLAHRLVWNLEQPKTDASSSVVASKVAEEKPPNALEIVTSDELPVTNVPSKRTFNYAAAAAAGTSHAKQPVLPTVQIKNATIAPATASAPAPVVEQDSTQAEPAPRAENGDVKKRRNRGGRKHRARTDAQRAVQGSEATPSQRAVETLQEPTVDAAEAPVSSAQSPPRTDGAGAVETAELPPMPRTEPTNAWAARAAAKEAKEKKQAENAAAAAVVNPPVAPVVAAADNSAADSITLKFGSLGLGALNPVNWLAHEKAGPVQEKSVSSMSTPTASAPAVSRVPGVPATIPGIANPSVSVGTATTSTSEPTLPVTSTADGLAPPPRDPIAPSLMPTSTSLPVVSGAIGNGSGIFPVMPPLPQNYPAYNVGMMPGYSPYESGSDLNNSHNLNLLYDPSALPGMPTGATGGKYTSMPGLGDNSMLSGGPSISSSSKDMLGSGIGDGDKGNTSGTGVLPGAMDPLPAPGYMMPQYPYPMYGFPPYAQPGMQPGMGPPGPSHFGYPPAGQVTSQGGFGGYPGQSSNINKFNAGNAGRVGFGFDDGSSGLAGASGRNSAGLENMYGRGGYAPMSEHKGMDTSSYKNARSSVPSGLHGVAAGAGLSNPAPVASGMPYSEYSGGNSVHSGGLNVGNVGPGGWTNRQPGNGRSDGAIGNQAPGNNVLPGAAGNNGIYAPAPGAPGGYWTNSPYY